MKCPVCKEGDMIWEEGMYSILVRCSKCPHGWRESDVLNRLRNFGWQCFEIKKPKNRDGNCWVSPDGKWYNVGPVNHQMFAYYVMLELEGITEEERYRDIRDRLENAGDYLIKHGWIYIEDTWMTGTILRGYQKMTEKQYKVLKESFGNQRLFRGWTIRAMWLAKEDMKQEAKED
jgi:hypothetical protein